MNLEAWHKYRSSLDGVQELLYLSALAAEACLIYPWQRLISAAMGYPEMPFWGVLLLLWVPYLIAGLIAHLDLRADRRQALVAALIVLTALLAIRLQVYNAHNLAELGLGGPGIAEPQLGSTGRYYAPWDLSWLADMVDRLFRFESVLPPELIAILLVLIGWGRGIVASRKTYETHHVWFRFRFGIIVLVGYFFASLLGHRADPTGLVFGYFFFGLMSIALSSILEQGSISQSTLGSRQWVAVLSGTILGNLGLALLVSLLFSRQVLHTVFGWFRPLGHLIQLAGWYLLSVVVYLLWPLLEWLIAWAKQIQESGLTFNISPLMSPLATPQEILESERGANLAPYFRTAFVVLVILGGLFLVARMIRKLNEAQAKRQEIERESVWSGDDLVTDLRNSLQRGWNQIKAFVGQLGGRHQRSAASIRKMYASMVDLAEEAGYVRRPAQTPYEYRPALHSAFPDAQEAVDAITEAYVRVHYGEVPDSQAGMDRLVAYWKQIEALAASQD